jgi:hypothetical protein
MANDDEPGAVVTDAAFPVTVDRVDGPYTLLRFGDGSKRMTLPTAFPDLGTKQHAANGQKG